MRAQSSGFWIENLNPVTVDGVVNAPDGSGTLVLSNTMNVAMKDSIDLYELHFCSDVPDSLKISVDWLLYRNGELVNGNLSDYAEIDMYTWYPELNNQGNAMAIHWVGGRLPNAFGYCDQPVQPDMFSGYDCGHAPTNYPGALQADYAAPRSVFNALGELVPSQGLYSLYTEAFDYFYAKFFQYGRTVVQIKWKQPGNYSLVMRIRERLGGTDWYNAYYNNDEHLLAGGHMSCCGQVLASDSIHYLVNGEFSKEVCQDAVPYTYGNPPYDFDRTMEDTNVVFGHIDPLHCDIFVVDSIIDFHFFVRHNPVIRVATHIDTLCSCDPYIPEDLFGVTLDPVDLDVASDTSVQWFHWGARGYDWYENADYYGPMTRRTANDTTYVYIVRQVNSYNNFNDEIVCEGKADTMYLTIKRIEAPELSPNLDVCLETIDSSSVHHATSTHDARCSTTTRWYTKLTTGITTQLSAWIDLNSLVYVGDDFPINLLQYAPTTNVDKKVTFYAVSYNDSTGCMSKYFSRYEIQYHQTPVLTKVTSPADINCPGDTVTMKVAINNTPSQTDPLYTYFWDGVTNVNVDGTIVPPVSYDEVTIGTSTSNQNLPLKTDSKYSYSQQIFYPTELEAGIITKMAFQTSGAITRNNVEIYLNTTDVNNFSSNSVWVEQGEKVFTGTLKSTAAGWIEIALDEPYQYDASKNLVVTVYNKSNTDAGYNYFYSTSTSSNSSMYASGSNSSFNPASTSTRKTVKSYRSNTKFTVQSVVPGTQAKNQEAYFNIPDTAKCNDQYSSYVYVVDGNGCVSQPDTFTYGVGVRTAPRVVNVPTAPAKIYVCELNADSIPAYTTIEDVTAAGIRVIDECGKGMTVTHTDAMFRGVCHDTLERVYTIHNLCDSTVSFTLTYISYDTVKPIFVRDTMELPLVQLRPLPGGNCTYNSPDSMDFVNAVAAMVYDNCTDSAFLMSTVEFFWENTTKSPINDTNIFRVNNHLTVTAVIHDICNNYSDSTLVIYLDLPDTMWISGDPTVLPTVCEGVTPANLVFDTTLIHSDAFVGPYLPYTYEWSEVNGREVTFTNKYAKETGINPVGSGDFVFQLKVTDNNGCEALSAFYFLHVNPIPNIHVTEIPYGGATRPYCPTYGWMTVGVFDANTGNRYPASANMSYTWAGEGVNIFSTFDTTIVNIVPDSCDHDYMAIVTVADPIGCSATDTVIFPVRDTEGPIILDGVLHDTVLVANNQCKFTVPNYRPFLNTSNVTSKCGYSPTQILETYVQTPAAGTLINKDTTAIKITLTTPCGKDSVYTVYAFRPDDYVTVTVTVDGDSVCENDPTYIQNGITLTATAQNGTAPYTYAWTKGASSTVIGTDATLTVHDTNGVYTYHVAVKDAHNCPVGDQADITVWYKGAPVVYQVTPNRICDGHNGTLTILEAPTGYTYNFQGQTKISDNASHEPTLYNTVYFADLYSGTYTLTVTTIDPENCETTTDITIPNVTAEVDTVVATALAVSNCLDNNGAITITRQAGYTYYFSTDGTTYAETELTVIPNLASGTYYFYRKNNATNCESPRTSVYVPYNAPSFDFTINSVNNNSYCYDDQADGSFKLASNNVDYVVTLGNDTIYQGGSATVNNLAAATYTIYGVSTINGCSKEKTQTITNGKRSYPSATIATTPNRYCDPTQANGSITVTKKSSSPAFTYTVLLGTDTIQPANYASLYAGTYTVNMITDKGCTGTGSKAVENNQVNPNVTATAKTNSTCIPEDFDGKITLTVTNSSAAGPGFTYMLWQFNADTTIQTNGTFTGLASGRYNYTVVSQYGCVKEAYKDVDQYKVPALDLDSTANFMCEPTATKPGDGTITIMAPRNSNTKHYHYKYYDAAGHEYDVPFDEPFVYTLYWLADGMYRVTALELETNCMAEDSIYVPLDRYNVTINTNATGNKYCTKNFNGTITVNAISTNPDARLQYKVVGVNNDYTSEYTFNPVFTGLQDGTYQVMVRDTNTACVYVKEGNVTVEKIANDITITPTITPDHACEGGNHDGSLSVVASTTTFDNTFFMFKFNQDADFSTTSSWTGLNSSTRYNVTVIDTISGCTVDSIFSIPLENVCAPIITINGNNKFCLNEENAQICATATNNTDVCPEGNYQFMWVIRCHHDTVYNACVDVNTSSVHNCFYDLYVKDLNTGCVSNASVEVEILPINTVNFTINHAPFYADPRTYEHCVADSVWVGVQKDKWVSVLWSNGYVTPDSKKPLDLEFCVPANTNNPNHMYTYCVDAIDSNGCPARSEINLFGNPVPRTTVHDTACFEFRFENEVITYSDDVTYPITREKIYPRVDNKHCDSIVTHEIVIKPHVTADFTKATAFLSDVYCTPTNILSQMRDSVKYSHGTLEVQIKRNNEWETFTNLNQLSLNYADSTFRFYVYNDCESKSQEFQISMNKAPQVDTFKLDTYYCASSQATFKATVSEFSKIHNNATSSTYVKMYFANDEANPFTCTNTTNKVNGTLQPFYFTYTPTMADNGRKVVTKVWNNCGTATDTVVLVVDTTFINITNDTICENDVLDFASILGNQMSHYTNLVAHLTAPTGIYATVPPVAMFSVNDTMANHGFANESSLQTYSPVTVNDQISFSSNGQYYTSNATARVYSGNNFYVNVADGYQISKVVFNCVQTPTAYKAYVDNETTTTSSVTVANNTVTISGITANEYVKFTVQNGSLRFKSMYVEYNNIPDNTPVTVYTYDNAQTIDYVPGTPVALDYDHAQIYFTGTGKCGNITSDTAILVVNPLPVLTVNDHYADLCIAQAADSIARCVSTMYADTTCWLYLDPTLDTIWQETFNSSIPATWKKYKLAMGNGWTVNSSAAYSEAYNGNNRSHVNNWLFTPAIDVQGNMTLTYDVTKRNYSSGFYNVYVLTADTVNPHATAVFSEQPPYTGYVNRSIDLSSYAGQQVYVAFQHKADVYGHSLFIDNVTLKQAGHLVPVKNVAALVDSIKSMPQADVYYYAANGCQELTKKVGTFRILDTVTLTASDISVCPNDDLSDISLALNASIIDYGNYRTNEIKPVAVGNDGNLYDLNSHVALNTVLYNGQIRIVATATNAQQPIDFCAIDTAKATITVLTNDFKQDTLQKACDATEFANFIKAAPVWTGTVNVQNDIEHQFWTVSYLDNQTVKSKVITTDSIMKQGRHISVHYTWITDCGDTLRTSEKNLQFYVNPVATIVPDTVYKCSGDTLFMNEITLTVTDPDQIAEDTTWTLDGAAFTGEYIVVTEDVNGSILKGTVGTACQDTYDSVVIIMNPLPVVVVNGPARACSGEQVKFVATPGFVSYTFYVNGVETTTETPNDPADLPVLDNELYVTVYANGVEFTEVNALVENENGCEAQAEIPASVRVTAMPQFVFFDSTGMANATTNINGGVYDPADETHYFTATTGNGMKYVWMVNNECYNPDTLVYVEYDIYFNDRLISNDSIDDWYLIPSTYNYHGQSPLWVTSNQIFWEANDHTAKNNISYYNYAIGDPSIYVNLNEYGGNHYPNTNMGFSNSNVYDDLWMHYLAGRPVTQEISGFRRQGEYKIVFRLYATSNPNKFYHPYTHTNEDGTTEMKYIGGSNANANDAIITLLAMDSITIDVTGEDVLEPTVVNPNNAPELAPELSVDETVVPDMEVWPNPAPATETTLKARVHNMDGNATVTLTNLNGKQVYNGNIYIDNANFYFEFGVNNLSVGSYILTVRTNDAVLTKKVIVTVAR